MIRLIHMCDMTHSYVWHDSFMCVTWLITVGCNKKDDDCNTDKQSGFRPSSVGGRRVPETWRCTRSWTSVWTSVEPPFLSDFPLRWHSWNFSCVAVVWWMFLSTKIDAICVQTLAAICCNSGVGRYRYVGVVWGGYDEFKNIGLSCRIWSPLFFLFSTPSKPFTLKP